MMHVQKCPPALHPKLADATEFSKRFQPVAPTLEKRITGMRGSELRGLRWRNVDLENGSIHICERVNTRNKFGPPKSEAGTRDIPLPDTLITILVEWRKICPKSDDDLVFPNGAGNVEYHQNILNRCFFPLQEELGITVKTDKHNKDGKPVMAAKYGLHALRHAAASLFIEQKFAPKKVQTLMGHSSIQITFDLYGYLFDADNADNAAMKSIADRSIGA